MVFSPSDRSKVVMSCFSEFSASGEKLQYVQSFKYLGNVISSNNTDDADIQREITNMFIRTNILARKFYKCTAAVKTVLFRSYCICLYDAALWTNLKVGMLNKLRSCYNRCIKIFFDYSRRDSVTSVLFNLGLPSFDTLMKNASVSYSRLQNCCSNRLVVHMCQLSVFWQLSLLYSLSL